MIFLKKLWKCLFKWDMEEDGVKKVNFLPPEAKVDAIVGVSYGLGENLTPGKTNKALASSMSRWRCLYGLPICVQWEIADALNQEIAYVVRENLSKPGKYLDTYEVLRQAKIFCEARGWKRIIIVAQPIHAWRVVMVARKLGFEVPYVADTDGIPYDVLSVQWWTVNERVFKSYEKKARLFYLLTGKI
jgi:uncharacterized SAM-binding protein YcdF (DUF218 family)